jgi:hypothetical protein
MRELVAKNALVSSFLPAYLLDWINVFSSLCVYTTAQTTKFSELHLQAAGWYLDCSAEFVSGEEKALFASLVSSTPEENIVTFEELDIVELSPPPSKAPRRNGRAKKTDTQACKLVHIAFYFTSNESYEFVFIVADSEVQHQVLVRINSVLRVREDAM